MSCDVPHRCEGGPAPVEQSLGEACDSDEDSIEQALPEPPGPKASEMFSDLFRWPQRYAQKILKSASPHAVSALLTHDFVHHENFSGTGSAGISLHMIHRAFCDELRNKHGLSSASMMLTCIHVNFLFLPVENRLLIDH